MAHPDPVHYTLFSTSLGDCGIAWRDELIVGTNLPEADSQATEARIARRSGASRSEPSPSVRETIRQIVALLEGEAVDLSEIACDFSHVDSFSDRVYQRARAIPVGETATYGDIATHLGDRQWARRVGRVMGNNPYPIIVPCHRVVGANDNMVGFSAYGGIATKKKMLSIERGGDGETMGLFDGLD